MNDINIIITLLAVSTAISIVLNAIIRNFAKENNFLMDIPDDIRKFHKRTTPLIGGIAICFSYVLSFGIAFVLSPELFSDSRLNYQISIAVMSLLVVATFIFDDLLNLKAALRIFLQSFLVLTIIILTNVYIKVLPNIFGFGEISLGLFGIPFSVFCVVGIMNAFNMIDGLDGLCATISFNALLVVCLHCNAPLIALVLGSITGFVFYNMGIFGKKRKVFLGDAGSNLLGFITASMLIFFSKDLGHGVELGSMSAVTALWFVAIPLVDCIRVIIYRIQKGRKPFSADRIHFHYMLLDLGIDKNKIFWIYYGMSILFLLIGITFDKIFEEQIYFSFALFAFFSFVYLLYTKDLERRIKNVN